MTIEPDQVRQVAALARLHLDAAALERMAGDLEEILTYVAQLQDLDLEGVEPWRPPARQGTPLRPDVVAARDAADLVPPGGLFSVPRVLE